MPLRFTGAGTLSVRTSALNLWQSTGWPVSGGTDDLPDHIWNKSDGETLVMTAAYDTTIKNLTSNLTGDDPVVSALDTQNFNLEKNQLVALGSMTLDIDTPDSQSLALSGHTSSGAALTAAYTLNDGKDGTTDGTVSYTHLYQGMAMKSACMRGNVVPFMQETWYLTGK